MASVGVVALVLAAEPPMYRFAAEVVSSGDEQYIWGEAVAVWIILNAALSPLIGLPVLVVWVHKKENDRQRERKA
jgi:hypothetical protein